jgi:predicted nucleic acid-binding protein
VQTVREQALLAMAPDLGPGEREALALAVQIPDSLVLLVEAAARRHARLLGISVTGTLGVLLKAKETGYLAAVGPVLDTLDALRFRLDPVTRASFLRLAGEEP